jgi:hypothetical protein
VSARSFNESIPEKQLACEYRNIDCVDKSKSWTGIQRDPKPIVGFTINNKHAYHFLIFSYMQFRSYSMKNFHFKFVLLRQYIEKWQTTYFERKEQDYNWE